MNTHQMLDKLFETAQQQAERIQQLEDRIAKLEDAFLCPLCDGLLGDEKGVHQSCANEENAKSDLMLGEWQPALVKLGE